MNAIISKDVSSHSPPSRTLDAFNTDTRLVKKYSCAPFCWTHFVFRTTYVKCYFPSTPSIFITKQTAYIPAHCKPRGSRIGNCQCEQTVGRNLSPRSRVLWNTQCSVQECFTPRWLWHLLIVQVHSPVHLSQKIICTCIASRLHCWFVYLICHAKEWTQRTWPAVTTVFRNNLKSSRWGQRRDKWKWSWKSKSRCGEVQSQELLADWSRSELGQENVKGIPRFDTSLHLWWFCTGYILATVHSEDPSEKWYKFVTVTPTQRQWATVGQYLAANVPTQIVEQKVMILWKIYNARNKCQNMEALSSTCSLHHLDERSTRQYLGSLHINEELWNIKKYPGHQIVLAGHFFFLSSWCYCYDPQQIAQGKTAAWEIFLDKSTNPLCIFQKKINDSFDKTFSIVALRVAQQHFPVKNQDKHNTVPCELFPTCLVKPKTVLSCFFTSSQSPTVSFFFCFCLAAQNFVSRKVFCLAEAWGSKWPQQ